MLSRRLFAGRIVKLFLLFPVLGSTFVSVGCSVVSEIASYVGVGLQAFQIVVDILRVQGVIQAGVGTTIDVVIALVKAAFADISAAVAAYENAPSASKQTLLGKLSTAIAVAIAQIQKFWSDLKIPNAGLAITIKDLLGVILSVLAGFASQLPAPASHPMITEAATLPNKLAVLPKKMTTSEFRKEFNSILDKNSLSDRHI